MARKFRNLVLGLLVLAVCLGTGFAQAVKIRVIADAGHVRLLPDAKSAVIKTVPKGAVVVADDLENEWFRVFLPAKETDFNLIGYIHQSEAEKIKTESLMPDGASAPKERKHPLSVKIFGGPAYLKVGSPNTVRDYFDQYFRSVAASAMSLVVLQGGIPSLHNGYNAGAEIIVEFDRFSLGLGTEYIKAENAGTMHFATKHWEPLIWTFSITDRMTVIPAKVNLYVTLLKSRIGQVRVFGGAGYYFGHFSDIWTGLNEKGEPLLFRQIANAQKLGFQGGLEIELNLGKNFALVAEGFGRLVKISGFSGSVEGTVGWFHQKAGISGTSRSGTLFYYELQLVPDGPWIPNLVIFKSAPSAKSLGLTNLQAIRNLSEASLDFSGYSARIGLKIRF